MMNINKTKLALLLAATMGLTACGGDDGNPGNPGNPGGEPAGVINTLNLDITEVRYENGAPVITVFATNEADLPVVGLTKLEVKKVLQLLPEGSTGPGNSANWQGLGSTKTFVDKKDGSYQFTIDNFDAAKFNNELTQRYNVVSAAGTLPDGTVVPVAEMVEDFDGHGNAPKYTKNIVSHDVCTACHVEGQKIYHAATEVETCISCHTQEMADGKGKPHVAFNHLIHNVHNSNKAWGKDQNKAETAQKLVNDNCQACHVEAEGLTEANNWSRVPTMETCSSCHTDIDFKAGKGHSAQADNSNCVACHNSNWTAEIHTTKSQTTKDLVAKYGMSAELKGNDDNTATLTLTINDTTGAAVDAASLVGQIQRLETITNVGPNFPIMGYNPSPGSGLKKVTKDLVAKGALQTDVKVVDGKLVYTTPALPFGTGDATTAFTFIGLEMCVSGSEFVNCGDGVATQSMNSELAYGTKAGETVSYRHIDSVDYASCKGCHGETFELHKGYHAGFILSEQLGREVNGKLTVGVDGCVTCHTPDGTYSPANLGALEMKVHQTHAHDAYKLIGGNCASCHNDFNLDSYKKKGALATEKGYTTPITATCTSCHTVGSAYMKHTQAQLESFGAIVNGDYVQANQAAQQETCFYCHKPTAAAHGTVNM